MNEGSIEKVSIFAYTDRDLKMPNNAVPQPFYLPVNPENYSQTFKIETDNRRATAIRARDPHYKSTAPKELKLDFILDGTGAIENYRYTDQSKKSVKGQSGCFLQTVYQMNGEIHRPNFLKVYWGEISGVSLRRFKH